MTTMTNGVPAVQNNLLGRLTPSQRIMLLTATVAVAAVALFVIVVRSLPGAPTALNLPWVLWAAAFALGEVLVVHWQWKRDAHSFSMGDLVLAVGLFLASPVQLVTAMALGAGAALLVHRRQTGVKLVFNMAEYALGSSVALVVFHALSTVLGSNLDWLAALVAVLAATLTADAAIFGIMIILEGRADVRQLGELLGLSVPFALGSAGMGLVVARTVVDDPAALALLALPTLLIIVAYRAYTGAKEQQDNLRLLHEVTSLLHNNGDSQAALGDFLDSVRTAFRAEMAELVLLGPAGQEGTTVSRSRQDAEPVVMAPL